MISTTYCGQTRRDPSPSAFTVCHCDRLFFVLSGTGQNLWGTQAGSIIRGRFFFRGKIGREYTRSRACIIFLTLVRVYSAKNFFEEKREWIFLFWQSKYQEFILKGYFWLKVVFVGSSNSSMFIGKWYIQKSGFHSRLEENKKGAKSYFKKHEGQILSFPL